MGGWPGGEVAGSCCSGCADDVGRSGGIPPIGAASVIDPASAAIAASSSAIIWPARAISDPE